MASTQQRANLRSPSFSAKATAVLYRKSLADTTASDITATTTTTVSPPTNPIWTHLRHLRPAGQDKTPTYLVKLPGDVPVFLVHEGQGVTHVTHASGPTDAVHVVIDVGGHIVVDDLCSSRRSRARHPVQHEGCGRGRAGGATV